MSRSGYSEDCENLNLYRGAVDRAIGGKRGQAFLREMAAALDAMPVKELVAHDLVREDGAVCAIGSVAVARKIDVSSIDENEPDDVAHRFGIARSLAAEIAFENDDDFCHHGKETPAERWTRMRKWVAENLTASAEQGDSSK